MNLAHLTLAGLAIFLFGVIFGHTLAMDSVSVSGAVIDSPATFSGSAQAPMPRDRISESQISVSASRVVLAVEEPSWSRFTDTNSMVPFLDAGANAIHVTPSRPEELVVGDIISYEIGGVSLIHRIIETGYDTRGWYAIVKGDANSAADPLKVRFEQIDRVLVAIIY